MGNTDNTEDIQGAAAWGGRSLLWGRWGGRRSDSPGAAGRGTVG